MATVTIQPDAESSPTLWTVVGAASKVAAVTDASDASYITSGGTNNTQQQFTLSACGLTPRDRIDSVAFVSRCTRGGASNVNFQTTAVLGANTTAGGAQTATSTTTDYTDTFTTQPGGGRWTVENVDALEYRIQNTQARVCRANNISVTVTYAQTVRRNSLSTCGGGR